MLNRVFLSYAEADREAIEAIAWRLQGDARLSFWFEPWHSFPGQPAQEQREQALRDAGACAVFIGAGALRGWHNEQLRVAIQTRVEDQPDYRIIPIVLPGAARPQPDNLPSFLRRYAPIEFAALDDDLAFRMLLAGILGLRPIDIDGFLQTQRQRLHLSPPPTGKFEHGHAVVIGVANYPRVRPLPETILNDARDLAALLTDPTRCGYQVEQVKLLIDAAATADNIRAALKDLAVRTGPEDTAIVFFSGHGGQVAGEEVTHQYLVPYDGVAANLPKTALVDEEVTQLLNDIRAGRLLVLFDSCHSGGAGDVKADSIERGLSEDYYARLAQGAGRVVIASSRLDQLSWTLPGMRNSLFTHYLLEALHGGARTLGDGFVRVFDVFRHISRQVPTKARQHPIFKAAAMQDDFPIALDAH